MFTQLASERHTLTFLVHSIFPNKYTHFHDNSNQRWTRICNRHWQNTNFIVDTKMKSGKTQLAQTWLANFSCRASGRPCRTGSTPWRSCRTATIRAAPTRRCDVWTLRPWSSGLRATSRYAPTSLKLATAQLVWTYQR